MKKFILSTLLILATLAACTQKASEISPEEQAARDRLALQVAVMPTTDCLPLYLAAECGIADSLGLEMRLRTYMAQMDVDTALQKGRVTVAYSDLIRALRLVDKTPLKAIMKGETSMSLVAVKGNRVNKIHQMKERMVAISRLSTSDYWCDQMLDSAFMLKEDLYRPQVHDIQLRTEMLRTNLVDAAILPEPYTQWMKLEGNPIVYTSPQKGPHFPAWVVLKDSTLDQRKEAQVRLLMEAYDIAAKQIKAGKHATLLKHILQHRYELPAASVDSMEIRCPEGALSPDSLSLYAAATFLEARERMPKGIKPDTLIWSKFTAAQ